MVYPPTIPVTVVVPPFSVAKPVILAALSTVPFDWVRFAAVPPVRLTVPAFTTRAPRVPLEVKPAVPETVDVPVTVPCTVVVPSEAVRLSSVVAAGTTRLVAALIVVAPML